MLPQVTKYFQTFFLSQALTAKIEFSKTRKSRREKDFQTLFMGEKILRNSLRYFVEKLPGDTFQSVTGLDAGEIETECCVLRRRLSTARVEKKNMK